MADIIAHLTMLIRMQCARPEAVKIPERSEILRTWCLPMLSRSIKADEDERKAMEMLNSVKRLNDKYSKDSKRK